MLEHKETHKETKEKFLVPEDEIDFEFFRASAPGGQKVNKTWSGVRLRWNIEKSAFLSEEEKRRIKNKLKSRIAKEGDLILESQEERSQFQNKKRVIEKFYDLIKGALTPEKKRKPIKISQKSKEKRLKEKKIISQKKKERGKINLEDYV